MVPTVKMMSSKSLSRSNQLLYVRIAGLYSRFIIAKLSSARVLALKKRILHPKNVMTEVKKNVCCCGYTVTIGLGVVCFFL
jgi:hypothetical protein